MTTKELENKVRDCGCVGYGTHKIEIEYYGTVYRFITNNTLATDRLKKCGDDGCEISDRKKHCFYTYRGALEALYEEGKRKHSLGKYFY